MPNALILGITGYAGSALARHLVAGGWSVRGLGRSEQAAPELDNLGVEVELADVLEPADLEGIGNPGDHVFYLIGSVTGAPAWVRRLGTQGVVNVHAALAGASIASFTFVDTLAVYGGGSDDVITEDSPTRPNSVLGRVNLAAETRLRQASTQNGFPARIVRAGTIYGPGRGTLNALREGRLRQIGDGANYMSRIQVDDLVLCLEAVAVRGRPGEVYLAVDDRPVSSATYFDHLAEAAGQDGPRVTPKPIARALVSLFSFLALVTRGASPLSHSVYALTTASYRCSNAKLRDELGVELRYPTHFDGIQALLQAEASDDRNLP